MICGVGVAAVVAGDVPGLAMQPAEIAIRIQTRNTGMHLCMDAFY
jgi:hypothetical protein